MDFLQFLGHDSILIIQELGERLAFAEDVLLCDGNDRIRFTILQVMLGMLETQFACRANFHHDTRVVFLMEKTSPMRPRLATCAKVKISKVENVSHCHWAMRRPYLQDCQVKVTQHFLGSADTKDEVDQIQRLSDFWAAHRGRFKMLNTVVYIAFPVGKLLL